MWERGLHRLSTRPTTLSIEAYAKKRIGHSIIYMYASSFPITGGYRQRSCRRVANGVEWVFPDNRKPLVYRKYIC
jgi:hypothetical protein